MLPFEHAAPQIPPILLDANTALFTFVTAQLLIVKLDEFF